MGFSVAAWRISFCCGLGSFCSTTHKITLRIWASFGQTLRNETNLLQDCSDLPDGLCKSRTVSKHLREENCLDMASRTSDRNRNSNVSGCRKCSGNQAFCDTCTSLRDSNSQEHQFTFYNDKIFLQKSTTPLAAFSFVV